MAEEPDSLVLKMLRDIRTTMDEHGSRLRDLTAKLDNVSGKVDDIQETMTYALGISMHANVRHEGVQKSLRNSTSVSSV